MNFKPGFHKAAMEYVRWLRGYKSDNSLIGEALMKQANKYRATRNALWDSIMSECEAERFNGTIRHATHEERVKAIIQYLAHTALHGWDE